MVSKIFIFQNSRGSSYSPLDPFMPNSLPLLWSQKVVSLPKMKSCPSLVTTALLPLLQAAYATVRDSRRIIFLGFTALGCLLALANEEKTCVMI